MEELDFRFFAGWDKETWGRAINYWHLSAIREKFELTEGLELGARDGKLSAFFHLEFGSKVICSDVINPEEIAMDFHSQLAVRNGEISYQKIDAINIPLPDESLDFVVFKSMMGAVGRNDKYENQLRAFKEINRVLKKGGVLFFAENQKGTWLHSWARRRLVPWGGSWRYMSIIDIQKSLDGFRQISIKHTGFISSFVPESFPRLKKFFSQLDSLLSGIIPNQWKYVCYGWAKK